MIQSPTYWLTLAASVAVFWALPPAWRLRFLATVSAAYIASFAPLAAGGAFAWAALFYLLPAWAQERRLRRWASGLVIAILGYLFWHKYLPPLRNAFEAAPALRDFAVPLGISYLAVKLVHYAVERSRGKLPAHGFGDFACYILLFPIFTAGPVERFDHFVAAREPKWNPALAAEGLTRIAHGLIKRFLLCEALLSPSLGLDRGAAGLLARLDQLGPLEVWSFFLLSFLYLYLEFSAYTDIAVGSARLFGLRILENFNWPILATSLADFWRRWHMSLSQWCRDYVYLPMIGWSRNPYVASYASFAVMGLWHAGSLHWLAWGLAHASGLAVYTRWTRLRQQRRWTPARGPAAGVAGWAGTMAFVTVVSAIPAFDKVGTLHDLARVACRLLGLPLPS